MICFLGCSKGWRTLSNSKGFFGNTFSEMKMCWEGVPLLWKAKVETYRNFLHNRNYSLTLCRQPVDGWTLQITRFLTKLPVISAKLMVHVTSDDKTRKADRLVISEQAQLLRKEFGLRDKKRLFWIKEIRPFDFREGASSICARTRLRPLRSASQFLLFIKVGILPHITLELT